MSSVSSKYSQIIKRIKDASKRKNKGNKNNFTKKEDNNCDWLENNINIDQIKYYEYSEFKNIQVIEKTVLRASLKDNFFVLKSFDDDDTTLHNVFRELELHKTIKHENILQFYGITKKETGAMYQLNKYILVVEYADSGTLGTYLNKHFKELNWKDKLGLAIQLSSAIKCLHDNIIYHNRLHENNILIHQKNIKLADFGNITEVPGTIETSKIFFMLPYVDPKSFDTANYNLGRMSDVYSIGVLLWQISSGYRPFHAEAYNANLVLAILHGQREKIVDKTPREYSNLYKSCWEYEPNNRPSMQQVVSTLDELKLVNYQEDIRDSATGWVKSLLDEKKVHFIPLEDLEYQEELGKGAFGSIIKAIWTKKSNYVVYKRLINTSIEYNPIDAFINELKIYLHLPNYSDRIVRCLGISKDYETNEYLLVMQYADGGDLRNYLRNKFKSLTWEDKKKLAFQIADGLNYLHNEKVLHRDLHSKNIVIHENNVKIIDFGLSRIRGQKTEQYMRNRGIVAYMDPKRFLDPNTQYTESSDIYSFGVLMWEISSGYPPFKDNNNPVSLALSITIGTREEIIPNTPEEYKNLYINCWDQEPNKRPSINKILDEFKIMGFGVNTIQKSKFSEESTDKEDQCNEPLVLDLHAKNDDPNLHSKGQDKSSSNIENFNNIETTGSIFWNDKLEARLCELYMNDDVVDIFWGQSIKKDHASDSLLRIYVITRGLHNSYPKEEIIADNQVIHFIAEESLIDLDVDPFPSQMKIPQNLKKNFDEILDDELGLSFREKHYNLVGISTGYKRIQGKLTDIPAILLHVRQKGILRRGCDIFPNKIRGFPVDVVEACVATPYGGLGADTCRRYQEKVKLGSSIGIGLEKENTTGTLSAIVCENELSMRIGILSCEHVLKFNEVDPEKNILYQPSYEDMFGQPKKKLNELLGLSQEPNSNSNEYYDDIEELKKKLKKAGNTDSTLAIYERGMRNNFCSKVYNKNFGVDAGFCVFNNKYRTLCSKGFPIFSDYFKEAKLSNCLEGIYTHDELNNFNYSIKVFKVGRTTGLTIGEMLPSDQSIACSLTSNSFKIAKNLAMEKKVPIYNNKDQKIFIGYMKSQLDSEICQNRKECYPVKWFDRQLVFKFNPGEFDYGDSGASVIDEKGKALGILHANWITPCQTYGIASPYFAVLEALNVNIYSSFNYTLASEQNQRN